MATGKALNGKPYAGNPHVRFDEGAGAPRHSGRSALLYLKLQKTTEIRGAIGMAAPRRGLVGRIALVAAIMCAAAPMYAATPTIDVSDDATALVVTVPAGCLTSMKLELAYDNGTAASSMYVRSDSANRSAWTNARTLSESVPAAGATYTVPFSELGVSADASFRLFTSSTDFALLDYVDQDDDNADHDTGITDNVCYGLELGQYSKAFTTSNKYPGILGTRQPNNSTGFSVQHNGTLKSVHFMQRINNKQAYTTRNVSTSAMNTYVFTNKVYTCNGTSFNAPTSGNSGASAWITPVGASGLNICMGRFPEQDPGLLLQSRWYYLRLYGANDDALLDYVPAKRKSDGVAGFYDRAAVKFVTPSGGGVFAGGNVTNNTFEVAATAVGDICSFSRLARIPAVTTLDTADGATLTITVRPGYGVGSKLYLAHDTADKGNEIADWTGMLEVCPSIPAVGGTYTVDLAAQGLDSGHVFRAFIADRYTFLERLHQDSDDDVIDTGIADTLCGGMELGYYSTGYSNMYASLLGTGFGSTAAASGFRVCLGGSTTKIMFGQFVNSLYTYKFVTFTANSCNVLKVENNTVRLNGGSAVLPESGNKSSWRTSPLGLSRLNAYMGRLPAEGTACYGWWYYLKMKGIDGNLLLDYVPARKSDGTVGFLDRVSRRFITPMGGGTLVAGDTVGEEAYVGVAVSEAMTCDAQMPVTATWIGGTSSAFDNPANWTCANYLGETLPATTLPVADVTDVTFGGEIAFNYTSAADRGWRNAKFIDCELADDCDWSGFGSGFALDGTIDLAGHALTIAGAPTGGEITSSATGDPVALHIVIPAGVTNENVDCAITGNIRLFKEGAGMLVATKYPQTYSGGTDIVAGTLKAGVPGSIDTISRASFFGTLMTLDVRKDGTLDSGGTYYWGHHTINLHGGTLTTSVNPSSYKFNPTINLTADSTYYVVTSCDLYNCAIDLGGHTLNIDFHNGAWMIFTSRAANGKIVATGNGVLNLNSGTTLDCSTCSFDITPKFHLAFSNFIVNDLTVRSAEVTYSNAGNKMSVKGRFTPVTQCFPNVELQDGATLDVSGCEGTWPTASSLPGRGLSFAANAAVTVAVGDRSKVPSRVVSWTTPPAGADTLTVRCDNPDIRLEVRSDGIYRKRGLMIIVK